MVNLQVFLWNFPVLDGAFLPTSQALFFCFCSVQMQYFRNVQTTETLPHLSENRGLPDITRPFFLCSLLFPNLFALFRHCFQSFNASRINISFLIRLQFVIAFVLILRND